MSRTEKVGYGICGYAGAGKSTAAEMIADWTGAINIETGDTVRAGAEDHFGVSADELSSDELGEYSTMRREEDGGDYVAQDIIDQLERRDDFPAKPVVVCGIRDTEVPALFRDWFDSFELIAIHADFDTRLHRLRGRGRNGEDAFDKHDLAERDGRESMWGTADCIARSDTVIWNEDDEEALANTIVRKL